MVLDGFISERWLRLKTRRSRLFTKCGEANRQRSTRPHRQQAPWLAWNRSVHLWSESSAMNARIAAAVGDMLVCAEVIPTGSGKILDECE
ncbi:hypothetical protein BO70DRAFT_33117 [Aspergillus heteromorphus CBS 117.55]|uniref:Uncharacterized protein n=1 Tax=Aspergillus heteromorphus CBS 117.55 TaxID=1448321 RepID=A0A317W8P5_9EURO|nr:uncharacterized protein BO70DRAFT_33117 [Aspergillus heteromorphus CBS 117.55]PWY82974.1 hypothetical protein BO70DRAFT_33117 [Aspergillus heteromorphus CBS 117.55]